MLNLLTTTSLILTLILLTILPQQCTTTPTQDNNNLHQNLPRGSSKTPRPLFGTSTLNTTQLPLILAATDTESRAGDTHSLDTIRNKLALYSYILDGQQFSALDQVFDEDAIASYPSPVGLLNGLDTIKDTLGKVQGEFEMSQTMLGNVFVEVVGDRDAFSVAYYRSVQFQAGTGQATYAVGMYQDSWFRFNPKNQAWRIIRRNVVDQMPATANSTMVGI